MCEKADQPARREAIIHRSEKPMVDCGMRASHALPAICSIGGDFRDERRVHATRGRTERKEMMSPRRDLSSRGRAPVSVFRLL